MIQSIQVGFFFELNFHTLQKNVNKEMPNIFWQFGWIIRFRMDDELIGCDNFFLSIFSHSTRQENVSIHTILKQQIFPLIRLEFLYIAPNDSNNKKRGLVISLTFWKFVCMFWSAVELDVHSTEKKKKYIIQSIARSCPFVNVKYVHRPTNVILCRQMPIEFVNNKKPNMM